MKKTGFFCFSLALCFALASLALCDANNIIGSEILEAKTIAISLEQASLKRFELEQNSDKTILFAIEKSIKSGKTDNEQFKQSVNNALLELAKKENIKFFSATATKKQYGQLQQKKNLPLEQEQLANNSIVFSINQQNSILIVEYSITGGLLKNNVFFASIENNSGSQLFLLPIDYSNKTIVIK